MNEKNQMQCTYVFYYDCKWYDMMLKQYVEIYPLQCHFILTYYDKKETTFHDMPYTKYKSYKTEIIFQFNQM